MNASSPAVESGKRDDNRPELQRALALCRLHRATLLVAKLNRLARNVHFLSGLMEAKVPFVAADMPQANDLTIHILAAVAQAEAKATSARTKAALAAAKARGTKLGGKRDNSASIHRTGVPAASRAKHEAMQERASDLLPVIESIQSDGAVSLRDIATALNDRGILTARGGQWSAVQVMRVLNSTK
jgi:DNA invertase Pin-like site-specific DNA recombinase